MNVLVPLLVGIPLGTAFLVAVVAHLKPLSGLVRPLALLAVAANLIIGVLLLTGGYGAGSVWAGGWSGQGKPIGVEMVYDGLSGLMVIVINLVALAAIIFAASYMKQFTTLWLFYALFLLMTGAMNGAVLSGDLFNLYVFIEVAAIASYGLVAFGTEREELEAAFRYLVLGVIASTFILVGITFLYSLTGQLNMAKVADALARLPRPQNWIQSPAVLLAAACVLGGLALKAAMVPFHSWLPDAHPSAPAPISAMLSGVLIKAVGVYALARIVFNVLGANVYYANLLIAMGVLSMVAGMFLALGQSDLKRLLAYSSISQAGYIVLALGVAADALSRGADSAAALCLFGGLFHLFNHASFKGLLFLCSGAIEQATGTRDLKEMGGLARAMPTTSFCCRVGALSISGVPPFNGFFSKLIIIIALAWSGHLVLCAIAAAVAVGTLLMYVKVQRYALEGEPSARTRSVHESPLAMRLGMAVLAAVCILGGLGGLLLKPYLFDPAGQALLKGVVGAATGGAP